MNQVGFFDLPDHLKRLSDAGDPLEALVSLTRYHDLVVCGLQSLFEHGVVDEPPNELAMLVEEGVRPM